MRGLVRGGARLLGNLDGLPARARSAANTVRLDRDLARLRRLEQPGLLTDRGASSPRARPGRRGARAPLADRVDPVTGEPVPAQPYTYEPDAFGGDGAVVIAAGDLDTADNVALLVPGLGTDGTDVPGLADHAADVYDTARTDDPRRDRGDRRVDRLRLHPATCPGSSTRTLPRPAVASSPTTSTA